MLKCQLIATCPPEIVSADASNSDFHLLFNIVYPSPHEPKHMHISINTCKSHIYMHYAITLLFVFPKLGSFTIKHLALLPQDFLIKTIVALQTHIQIPRRHQKEYIGYCTTICNTSYYHQSKHCVSRKLWGEQWYFGKKVMVGLLSILT